MIFEILLGFSSTQTYFCGTRDHIFNIHSVQLSYSCKMTICEGQILLKLWETIFSSSSRETPNRILPNLAHLLILCVFTSVLCEVNKEVKENNNNKNQIQSWPFIYTIKTC
jgi:hypothetical protein